MFEFSDISASNCDIRSKFYVLTQHTNIEDKHKFSFSGINAQTMYELRDLKETIVQHNDYAPSM